MLAGSATTGQATFEPDDEDELLADPPPDEPEEPEDPDELEELDELDEPDDSEPLLLPDESPDLDELSAPLRPLSFEPSAAGTVEPLRLSVR